MRVGGGRRSRWMGLSSAARPEAMAAETSSQWRTTRRRRARRTTRQGSRALPKLLSDLFRFALRTAKHNLRCGKFIGV